MLYLLPIFLTIIVLYIIRFYYDLIHAFWLSIKLNGPPALPIIGNGLLFFNKTSAGNCSVIRFVTSRELKPKLTFR